MSIDEALTSLYRRLIDAWNSKDADAMAALLAPGGVVIGFDGSQMVGREQVAAELGRIFADHDTASYVTKVRSVTPLGKDAGLLYAVAGMVLPGGSAIMADRNAIQTITARRSADGWSIALFQNTPARFDGRAELAESLTAELAELLLDSTP
jgi:uncharacterized protein (TIGR02246 family)